MSKFTPTEEQQIILDHIPLKGGTPQHSIIQIDSVAGS